MDLDRKWVNASDQTETILLFIGVDTPECIFTNTNEAKIGL